MHAGMFHLFVNMLSLFFIGRFLEMLIGKKRFFWVYIFSGLFAGLFFAVLAFFFGESSIGARIFSSPETSAVGASGAIFAIAGVLALITPKSKVYLIAGPLIALIIEAFIQNISIFKSFIGIIDILIYVYIFFCIFSMFSFNPSGNKIALPLQISFWALPLVAIVPLIIVGLFVELPIGNMAHLGGFLFGILYGVYLRIKYKKKVQIISNYFSR
jgi:membrane associated rhomboid family serine protease